MNKKLIFILFTIIIIIITIFIVSDVRFLTVTGTSMNPEITQDDVVIVWPVDNKDMELLRIGDIITYKRNIKGNIFMFSHRIIGIENGIIKTKGDNMPKEDEYNITYEDIIGKVIMKIPYIGYLIRFVHSTVGYLIFILIPTIILVTREIRKMTKAWKK